MSIKTLSIILSIFLLMMVVELIRREKLTFKYAIGWLALSLAAIVFSVFDQWLLNLADWFGFELASNFIFYILLGIFVLLSLLMTIFQCQQAEHNDVMAQKIGILENEVKQLKRKSASDHESKA